MDCKGRLKTIIGSKMQRRLAYYYYALSHRDKMVTAIKKISENKKFCNIHRGERCFILGNGPSLKEISLQTLKDEWVFTVNYFNKLEDYKAVKTNYHVWADPAFFNMNDAMHFDMKEVMECYEAISNENCECFVPMYAYEFFEKQGLLEKLKPNLLYADGNLEKRIETDICNTVTAYTNVVQYALTVAIYMGFSEIYLLGCDSTYIMGVFDNLLQINNHDLHAYRNDNAKKGMEEMLKYYSMSDIMKGQYLLFLGYEKLYKYCEEKGIKLYNCSNRTVVTSIPRIALEIVLS